jgi:hypothetical protein
MLPAPAKTFNIFAKGGRKEWWVLETTLREGL